MLKLEFQVRSISTVKISNTGRHPSYIETLQNNKTHGIDGIPGDADQILNQHLHEPIMNITNQIKHGAPLPETWIAGTLAHIYKNNGDAKQCEQYRPIAITREIYKIRPS